MARMSANIRNFCIIAHIDHGKSTLADRLLEVTGTIEKRKMREQVLDSMELERERGITIKMTPVRMVYHPDETIDPSLLTVNEKSQKSKVNSQKSDSEQSYVLNLIDTPGHIDFAYEVSRALKAVEGAVLLVDATQGVQAQTLTTLQMARDAGLVIIPAVNKIDSPLARVPETKKEIALLLCCPENEILEVSGKTGAGVAELLRVIVERVPPPLQPQTRDSGFRAMVFDFQYSNHTGVIVFVRVQNGEVKKADSLTLIAGKQGFKPIDVGVFTPEQTQKEKLSEGEIGYLVTGIKEPGIARVGDTITSAVHALPALPGFELPSPVVWASVYPESQDDFNLLRQSLDRLRLSDSSFVHEEEASGLLGRGFRCGFLGMLHMEIITERLRREFNLAIVVTTPSITYEVVTKSAAAQGFGETRAGKRADASPERALASPRREIIYSAARFPSYGEIAEVYEPWVEARIITPPEYLGPLMPLLHEHEAFLKTTENFGENRNLLILEMPLRELMRGFFDDVKSASSGFASLSYEIQELRKADVVKLELLVAEEVVPAFSRVVSRRRVETEAEAAVEKLHKILPKQLFVTKIQAVALGRIMSSRTLRAMQKDVTGHLYGGDRTRKMKLWQQQKEGKKRLKEGGKVRIPPEVFLKMVQSG
ncbi:MAG: GTP-binding protein [bacterium]|nr:GTP-binding protein [bacterium]